MISDDTIFALATAAGRAGVAVVRISGAEAWVSAARLIGGQLDEKFERVAQLKVLTDPKTGELVDQALVLAFRGPNSFTGEDVVELQCHGSMAVVQSLLDCLSVMPKMREASAGEFSRRALLNGKMSLMQTEALAGLLEADTQWQRSLTNSPRVSAQEALIKGWRASLLAILADIEAAIDFPDEGLDELDEEPWFSKIADLKLSLSSAVHHGEWLERRKDGFVVAIVGPPNSGKSSLINALVGRDLALVSDIQGTTRDSIEAHIDLNGLPVRLVDTAGLRDTDDVIESLGIDRTKAWVSDADLVLALKGPEQSWPHDLPNPHLKIETKADLFRPLGLAVSVKDPFLMKALKQRLHTELIGLLETRPLDLALSVTRQRKLACSCVEILSKLEKAEALELQAFKVRFAVESLSRLLGELDMDEFLDIVFSNFCIGK